MAAEATSAAAATDGASKGALGALRGMLRGDIVLALATLGILAVLLAPMPSMMLDFLLAISITFSVMILMTALFIHKPLEFSIFPTVLLFATMLRLALNLASTRLILTNGHEGTDAAGHVIEAFGAFIMQGSVVIGAIIFMILVLVNFIVITKGSSRIAEVAARFSLDAMPGKQMAIDADLSAGLITEEDARKRRKELEAESNFFGSMDGASKFVRGDAVAGLIITVINVIGGMIIGIAQKGMPFGEAANTYTLLTVGDGLVSQIPALIVSTAAGLLVSKASVEGSADKAFVAQFTNYPQALGFAAAVMAFMALLPGIPKVPFLLVAGACGYGSWYLFKQAPKAKAAAAAALPAPKTDAQAAEEPISQALAMDYLKVEIGYGLLPLVNDARGHRITDQIKALRRQLAAELGFVMPSVRIVDNVQLPPTTYVIRVKETEAGRGELLIGRLLAMDPQGHDIPIEGPKTTEPAFGLPATWIDEGQRDAASFRGLTVVDPATVLATHLTEIIKAHMSELLSYAETKKLIDDLPKEQRALLDDIVPAQLSLSAIQRVLQTLLTERISIRDLATILEGVAEAVTFTRNPTFIAEHVRSRLARQLCATHAGADGTLPLVTLSPKWEQQFADALVGQGEEKQLALAPGLIHEFIQEVRGAFDQAAYSGDQPILVTSPRIRPYVRSLVERFRPQTVVMSQAEIHPSARLRTVAQV